MIEESLDRTRTPAPLLPKRLPSGRGATEQPNNVDEKARLDTRFMGALVLTGVASGLLAAFAVELLRLAQELAFGHAERGSAGPWVGVEPSRLVAAPAIAGLVTGCLWWAARHRLPGSSNVDDVVWAGSGRLGFRTSLTTGSLAQLAVGAGASLGREGAPRLFGAASGGLAARVLGLTAEQTRLLVACGAGAGLAAAYNVPFAGALLAAEVMLGVLGLPVVLPALICAGVATGVAQALLGDVPAYAGLAPVASSPSLVVFAALAGPVLGVLAVAVTRLVGRATHHASRKPWMPALAFLVVGVAALIVPEVLGNGRELALTSFQSTQRAVLLLATFAILKPLLTSLCLWSGATGGLITPVLSSGAAVGALLGLGWSQLWPGTPLGAYAMICAAALLAAAMQAPLVGVVIMMELTRSLDRGVLPLVLCVALATLTARRIDGYSLSSARLPSAPRGLPSST